MTLRDFRRAGVDRDDATRARVRDARRRSWSRSARRSTATSAPTRRTPRVAPAALDGLPDDYVRAHPAGEDGLVQITTDYPDSCRS